MAISKPVRVPLEMHEDAETIAIKLTAKENTIVSKTDVIKRALEIGLKQLKTGKPQKE